MKVVNFYAESLPTAQAIPPIVAMHFSVAWSVCLSVVCHTLIKPFDGLRCHLAGTLVGFRDTLLYGIPETQGEGEIPGVGTPNQPTRTVSPVLPPGEYERIVRRRNGTSRRLQSVMTIRPRPNSTQAIRRRTFRCSYGDVLLKTNT